MFTSKFRMAKVATFAALLAAPFAAAQISPISEDFEGLDAMSETALGDSGWLVFANVFEADGTTFAYNYGAFPAPNGTGAFSNVAVGEGGPAQGAQQLVTFSDYQNADHGIGRVLETLVFQEQTIAAGDAGVWVFSFDAKGGDIEGASTAAAYVRTLDPMAGFFVTSDTKLEMTMLPSTWDTFSIAVNVSEAQVGQLFQIGFETRAANFEASGIVYDNVKLERFSGGIDSAYSQDFEALDAESGSALGDDGWLVFANVFAPDGTSFLYNYGAFPAPNGSGGFSNVAVGEGGPDQGEQQLVTFSDYNNTDHDPKVGNVIESLVFQERTITADDAGSWVFQFDAKAGDLAGASTAAAYVRTLDPMAGFFVTSNTEIDTTSLPTTWDTYEIAVNISPSQVGQLLQIGFSTRASNFEASGVLYDNIDFGPLGGEVDSDGDGIADDVDNCTLVANAPQRDTDGDGFGNFCDADFDNNCTINFADLGILKGNFFTGDRLTDLDGNGTVNFTDLGLLKASFFGTPGPSAIGPCVGT